MLSKSDNDSVEDGYLRTSEILGLDLSAELVNLSACETVLGKSYMAEGVIGLTRSFLLSGAGGVSATLWPVQDNATAMFMGIFYNYISEDLPVDQDFNETKKEFISGLHGAEYKKPYYWAPFVYYGK